MKSLTIRLLICGLLALVVPHPLPAQAEGAATEGLDLELPEAEPMGDSIEAADVEDESSTLVSLDLSLNLVGGDRDSFKFEEYRDLPQGLRVDLLHIETPDLYLDVTDLGQSDQYAFFTYGTQGNVRVDLFWDKVPHLLALDARTLTISDDIVGANGVNTILDSVQTALQGTPAAPATLDAALNSRLNSGRDVDVGFIRDKRGGVVDWPHSEHHHTRFEVDRTRREGTYPMFGNFGFASTIENLAPISDRTTNYRLFHDYSKDGTYVGASVTLSEFNNKVDTLIWDNPFRVTDNTHALAFLSINARGSSRGRLDLSPDNRYSNASLTFSKNQLPGNGKLTVLASFGQADQDDPLLAYTINSAVAPGGTVAPGFPLTTLPTFDASDPGTLPVAQANSEIQTRRINLRYTGRFNPKLRYNVGYKRFRRRNNSPTITFPGFVLEDGVFITEVMRNNSIGYMKQTGFGELSYDFDRRTTMTLGYENEDFRRSHHAVGNQDEERWKFDVRSRPNMKWDLRLNSGYGVRTGTYDRFRFFANRTVAPSQLPFMRAYDVAARQRYNHGFTARYTPSDTLSVGGNLRIQRDDYNESIFGLTEAQTDGYGLDVTWTATENLTLNGYYQHDATETVQQARAWASFGAGLGNPFTVDRTIESFGNWQAFVDEDADTVGIEAHYVMNPVKKRTLDLAYSASRANGKISFASPLASAAVDPNPVTPIPFDNFDDSLRQSIRVDYSTEIREGRSFRAGYILETLDIDDYALTGLTNGTVNTASGLPTSVINLGTLARDYTAEMFYAGYTALF